MTLEVNRLLTSLSTGMGAPPFEFVYRLMSIDVPSPLAREVTERLAMLWKIHREKSEADAAVRNGNGQPTVSRED